MKISMWRYLIFFISLLVFAGRAQAAPEISSVTGEFTNGSPIMISGSGFGTKANAAPLISSYDNSNPANNWSSGQIGGDWGVGGHPYLIDQSPRANVSQCSYKLTYNNSYSEDGYDSVRYRTGRPDSDLYISFWMYRDNPTLNMVTGSGNNSKFLRIYNWYGASGEGDEYYSLQSDANGNPSFLFSGGDRIVNTECSDWEIAYSAVNAIRYSRYSLSAVEFEALPKMQTWEHYEYYIHHPDVLQACDGINIIWKDGQTLARSVKVCVDGTSNSDRYILIGQVSGGFSPSYHDYIDQVYIDKTQAHVFLSDSPNVGWPDNAFVHHSEVQVCSSWSDSSITFTLNQGSFLAGQTVYLYVVNANGEINSPGYAITIGGGTGNALPSVNITSPTSEQTYNSDSNSLTLSGNAIDDDGITAITWINNRGGSGTANNDSGEWTSWSVMSIPLQKDENVITVTATDTTGQTATDTITVTYNAGGTVQVWSANDQTGDSDWDNSTATWCVRALIEGDSITQTGNQIMLGFQGRGSGDYRIRKVSIAEKDPNGEDGDVIDSTWTKVTFDGKDDSTWDSDIVTVPSGSMKLSNPVSFNIQPGKDYYVTYLLESPSVYLIAPSYYQEMYFEGSDHTENVDWSSNGHSTYEARLHAIAAIYVTSAGAKPDATPPTAPRNFSVE